MRTPPFLRLRPARLASLLLFLGLTACASIDPYEPVPASTNTSGQVDGGAATDATAGTSTNSTTGGNFSVGSGTTASPTTNTGGGSTGTSITTGTTTSSSTTGTTGVDSTTGTGTSGVDTTGTTTSATTSGGTTGVSATGESGTTGSATTGGSTGESGTTGETTGGSSGETTSGSTGETTGGSTDGHFPRLADDVDPHRDGPYRVSTYDDRALEHDTYLEPLIYYPRNAEPPFAVVAVTMGYTEDRGALSWLGEALASHGFVAFLTTPTNTSSVLHGPGARAEDLLAMVEILKSENSRSGSPLEGQLDTSRLGFSGHSMGGGASLHAAETLGTQVRAIAPMQPWSPGDTFPDVHAASLILCSENDSVAGVAQNARPFYESISATKVYAELDGAGHNAAHNVLGSRSEHDLLGRYIVAWFKLKLEDDERYRDYLYGAGHDEMANRFSRYETAN